MTLSAQTDPDLDPGSRLAALRAKLGSLLRDYSHRAEGRHRTDVQRLHRCTRCGHTSSLGRVLLHSTLPHPFKGYLVVCRDGLACAVRRASQRVTPAIPAEPMAMTLAALRRTSDR